MTARLPRILTGYVAAAVVTAVLLTLIMFYSLNYFATAPFGVADWLYAGLLFAFWTMVITLLPSALLIVLAERFGWRNMLFYEGYGAAISLPLTFRFDAGFILQCCAAGAIAGFAYWLIAGRAAGQVSPLRSATAQ